MDSDRLLLARLEDLSAQAADRYMITSGSFLDAHQRRLAEDFCKGRKLPVRALFYGGYGDADRCMPVFLPDYAAEEDAADLVRIIRVSIPAGGRKLTHRDYLGSLLSLGIDREVTGDILVREEAVPAGEGRAALSAGADIIVREDIAEFIAANYDKAGRTWLKTEILPVEELFIAPARTEIISDTIASLRLDSVVASAFRVSRAKAAEAVRRGLVSVNSMETLKTDMEIREGDKITWRGRGRVFLDQAGGVSRKGRIRVQYRACR